MMKILTILSLAALNSSIAFAGAQQVFFECKTKNVSLSSFVFSFERPENSNFSTPVKMSSRVGENFGTMSCSLENPQTRLADHYMINIITNGAMGFLNIDLVVNPEFDSATGYGVNSKIETMIVSCTKQKDYMRE